MTSGYIVNKTRDPDMPGAQYLKNSWRCCLATVAIR